MGRKYSPAYANIYLAEWESEVFSLCPKKPLLYFRFLDDLGGLWQHTSDDFEEFMGILNTYHPRIKLQHILDPVKVQFLDTEVSFMEREGGEISKRLATKVYFKDTDRHALLHKLSFHPRHTFGGIIKAQIIRFYRLCTYQTDVDNACKILFDALKPRGYSERFLRKIKTEVAELFRNKQGAFGAQPEQEGALIPFVVQYSTMSLQLRNKVGKHFIEATTQCTELQQFRFITAQRRNKNLQDILVHARLAPDKRTTRTRNQVALQYVPYLLNRWTGKGAPVTRRLTLDTKNIIYAIRCATCHKLYIGETKNALKHRLKQHIYHLARGKLTTVLYSHFQSDRCQTYSFFALEHCVLWSDAHRKWTEHQWINKLQSFHPFGLNNPPANSDDENETF